MSFQDALKTLGSMGCTSRDDPIALSELENHHLHHPYQTGLMKFHPHSLWIVKPFYLHWKHSQQDPVQAVLSCEHSTFWMPSNVNVSISPWLSGAPLTALNKKSGEIRSIAVGGVIRRLVSQICCTAVKPRLQEVFLHYRQVGVGVSGGLETAIHNLKSYIATNNRRKDLCCFKVNMWNAFNECHCK